MRGMKILRASAMAALVIFCQLPAGAAPQRGRGGNDAGDVTVLKPARVFDGETTHEGWAVRVRGSRIDAVGPAAGIAAPGAKEIDLPGTTLLPGLVEGHSHVLLHPYNETSWNDQVAHEALALRTARAVNHLRATLMAGFTLVRDLGTEGAGYADVGLKDAVDQGIIPGPRMLVVHARDRRHRQLRPERIRAGVDRAAGRRGSRRHRRLSRVVRSQIGKGADWVKFYADYRWGPLPRARIRRSRRSRWRSACRSRTCRARRSPRTRHRLKACATRSSPAWTRSSTATPARRRFSR